MQHIYYKSSLGKEIKQYVLYIFDLLLYAFNSIVFRYKGKFVYLFTKLSHNYITAQQPKC